MKKERQVSAGEVLTKNLLNRLTNDVWYFGVKGHLKVIKEKEPKSPNNLFDKENKHVVAIPKKAIKGCTEKFIKDFEKTMNASIYKIQLI